MILGLLGCGDAVPELVAERSRAVGEVSAGHPVTATLRGWRHPAGNGPDGFAFAHERWYVAWSVADARGDADHTWLFGDRAEAEAVFDALAVAACAAPDRAAFRVSGPDATWRLLVPDGPAAVVGLVEVDAASCADALAWVASGEAYFRDRVDHPDACAHLVHRGRRPDALRCLLRQDPGTAARTPSRRELPNAANDPDFDDDLVAVLADPAPQRFAPYRVTALLPELDPDQQDRVLAALRARARPLVGWEAALLGQPMPAVPAPWHPPGRVPDLPCAPEVRLVPERCP